MKKIIVLLLPLIILTGCNKEERINTKNLFYMDTIINIKIYSNDNNKVNKAIDYIDSLYNQYQNIADYYNEDSQLYKLNHGNSDVSDALKQIINIGIDWYHKSNGLFNINIGGITKLWHDFRENQVLPTNDELNNIDINIYKDFFNSDNINVDLGGIAKGYVTELAGKYLEEQGLDYYIINAGGNVKVGKSYKGYYNIGITDPDDTNKTFTVVKGEDISVVSSGSYQRYVDFNGKRYHHLIDPNTRYPANYIKSVTVIGNDSGQCDALSTILFLMSVDDGKNFIKDYDVDVIWYTNDNEIIKSDGFKYE